ncbi:MAG: helix-turn-helix transcriptional regulator [Fimbriimonadaceae bacterium]|nr:helix-turn-helix transcriptional regulator [Fimbriimonadaceae bacterium]QYK58132.1 MAG: helix-turn-helix transcriptional regulator [Fimbriimonadaceae bacterium]
MGELLRELRESQGLSQRELAKRMDRTQAFVWKVEQGIQHLDIPTLIDLATVLGTSASSLLGTLEATSSAKGRL